MHPTITRYRAAGAPAHLVRARLAAQPTAATVGRILRARAIVATDVGWTVYEDGQPIGWVSRGEDTETIPPGSFLAVPRGPVIDWYCGEPMPSVEASARAIRATYRQR